MAAEPASKPRRFRGDRGASLVEFALVLPVLALLMFGIIDFGTLYSDYQGLRNGVRDGSRNAAVTNWGSDTSCLTAGHNFAGDSEARKVVCDVKNKVGLGNDVRVGVWVPGGWQVGSTLRVCSQYGMASTTGITASFINGKAMTSKVEFRIELELNDGDVFTAGQEPAVTSWPTTCTTG